MNANTSFETNGTSHTRAYSRRSVAPAVDVFENGDELLVVADLPGVHASGVDLRIENDELTLSARRPPRSDPSPAVVREYEEVNFAASFRIPTGVDAAAVTAETKNGILVVKLPKGAAARTWKITVKSGE